MKLRIRETGRVIDEAEFRELNSNIYFPPGEIDESTLNKFGVDYLYEGEPATGGNVYYYSQLAGTEKKEDGKWYTKYVLGPIFTDQAAYYSRETGEFFPAVTAAQQEADYKAIIDATQAASILSERDRKLQESDWSQVEDSPVDKAAWATYRQALREISAQAGFPWTITWPVQPEQNVLN